MRLNPSCVRDILIALEPITNGRSTYIFNTWEIFRENFPDLQKYSEDELAYHVHQCNLTGFLYHAKFPAQDGFTLVDLTPSAHEFLANIRSEKNWKKVLHALSEAGVYTLSGAQMVAANVAAAALNAQLNF